MRSEDKFKRTVCGVGYIGDGVYKVRENYEWSPIYTRWRQIMQRCYDKNAKARMAYYDGCYVHPDWHNFQNFAEWFEQQYKEDGWQVDKDILVVGNREYGPYTCAMVPSIINTAVSKNRGRVLPQGVSTKGRRFAARVSSPNGRVHLGTYDTPEEAFEAYKEAKEAYIQGLAEEYKGRIREDVYEALMNFEVYPF